jgi:hypothetical protein
MAVLGVAVGAGLVPPRPVEKSPERLAAYVRAAGIEPVEASMERRLKLVLSHGFLWHRRAMQSPVAIYERCVRPQH